ncbi:hypothetical protein WJX81_002713 [Elliptochloris bilobata]|uniref:TRAF3-interacting protein 1 N-terminal domain-containing protein n=1 Tax=Elliptochloris bilobata TaxID=381761 RepID=A0AAW1QCF4_9CHLO
MEEAQLYWQRTQTLLQGSEPPLVRHPKLTAALLQKPPFRFLHDVISEVQATTGFAAGLFQGAELDARQLQDREKRVAYLQKAFDAVGAALGVAIAANPAMVLAGADAESTNAFLQLLAQAARATSAARSGGLPHAGLGNVASIRLPDDLAMASELVHAVGQATALLGRDSERLVGGLAAAAAEQRAWRSERQALQAALAARAAAARAVTDLPGKAL